jgi:hypothetical protein
MKQIQFYSCRTQQIGKEALTNVAHYKPVFDDEEHQLLFFSIFHSPAQGIQ